MKCKCKNGKLEEIAETKDRDEDMIRKVSYAECTECPKVFKRYRLPSATTGYMQYNGPLTPEEIKLHAQRMTGSFSIYDLSEIIKKR